MGTMIVRAMFVLVLSAALACCTNATSVSGPLLPTSTPVAAAPHTASAVIAQAHAALDNGNYELAVALLAPQAGASTELAALLAETRLAWADAMLRQPASAEARRAAFDQLSLGLAIAADAELRGRLETRRAAVFIVEPATPAAQQPAIQPPVAQQPVAAPRQSGASTAPRPIARPTAQPTPAFVVAQRKSFDGSGESGQFASCVDVQIVGQGGPVAGAIVGINNGQHSYQNQTDASGYTGRCGLGASSWSVVLFWTPDGAANNVATTVYLSGSPDQRAAVVFGQ